MNLFGMPNLSVIPHQSFMSATDVPSALPNKLFKEDKEDETNITSAV